MQTAPTATAHAMVVTEPTTTASTVFHAPQPGERRLRNIRQLTFGGNNAEAYFSNDGQWLTFQRQRAIDEGCDQQFIMRIDGSDRRQISNGLGRTTCGYFIENDQRIIFSSTFRDDPACPAPLDRSQGYVWPLGRFELFTVKRDGTDLQQITNNGAYNAEATVARDGSRVIYTSTQDGDVELYTMKPDGTDIRRITNRVGYDGGAFFSPDGSKIVWRAQYPETAADTADYQRLLAQRMVRPAKLELWVANADGSAPRQLTNLGGANFAPFFHPDGKRIIFVSNHKDPRGRAFDLYLINVDGTGLEQVTNFGDFDGFPMFSPDGSKLIFASNRHGASPGETNLFIADWMD
jgi:Tol biopolymer transport system component